MEVVVYDQPRRILEAGSQGLLSTNVVVDDGAGNHCWVVVERVG